MNISVESAGLISSYYSLSLIHGDTHRNVSTRIGFVMEILRMLVLTCYRKREMCYKWIGLN